LINILFRKLIVISQLSYTLLTFYLKEDYYKAFLSRLYKFSVYLYCRGELNAKRLFLSQCEGRINLSRRVWTFTTALYRLVHRFANFIFIDLYIPYACFYFNFRLFCERE